MVEPCCPELLLNDDEFYLFMGDSITETYQLTGNVINRLTFPGLEYVEEIWDSFSFNPGVAPFNIGSTTLWGNTAIACADDGYTYAWFVNFAAGAVCVAKFPVEDPESDFVILWSSFVDFDSEVQVALTWHPETPDVVWCILMEEATAANDLFTVDVDTGDRVDKLDLAPIWGTNSNNSFSFAQYATGLVPQFPSYQFYHGGNELILAYDVVSETWDSIEFFDQVNQMVAVYPSGKVIYGSPTFDGLSWEVLGAVQISGDPVTISETTFSCDAPFFAPYEGDPTEYAHSPYVWLAPLDRSHTYVTEDFLWELLSCEPPPPPIQRQPDPRPPLADDSCILGCPETRVYAMDFCGANVICDLTEHVTFAKWGRELDDESEVEVTVHLPGDASGAACCECIAKLRTWRNEIMIVRGGEVVWGPGPIVTIGIQRQLVHITARDIVAWLDVRLVHNAYNFVQVDLATIAQTIVEDALLEGAARDLPADVRDACILDFATFTETGKLRDMEILANRRSAGEVLRELATQGLDFTVVNRALYVGADFAFGPVGPLFDDAFQEDLLVAERGLAAANKWWISSDTTQGSCGGPDEFFGLIERGVEGQAAATSVQDMTDEACDRLRISFPPPLIVTVPSEGQLSQIAPICPRQMVPGTLVDLAIGELCRPATVRERLTSVRFTIDEHGEHPGITLAPMGEFAPTEEAPA